VPGWRPAFVARRVGSVAASLVQLAASWPGGSAHGSDRRARVGSLCSWHGDRLAGLALRPAGPGGSL